MSDRLMKAWTTGGGENKEGWAKSVGWMIKEGGVPTDEGGELDRRNREDSQDAGGAGELEKRDIVWMGGEAKDGETERADEGGKRASHGKDKGDAKGGPLQWEATADVAAEGWELTESKGVASGDRCRDRKDLIQMMKKRIEEETKEAGEEGGRAGGGS